MGEGELRSLCVSWLEFEVNALITSPVQPDASAKQARDFVTAQRTAWNTWSLRCADEQNIGGLGTYLIFIFKNLRLLHYRSESKLTGTKYAIKMVK